MYTQAMHSALVGQRLRADTSQCIVAGASLYRIPFFKDVDQAGLDAALSSGRVHGLEVYCNFLLDRISLALGKPNCTLQSLSIVGMIDHVDVKHDLPWGVSRAGCRHAPCDPGAGT